MGGEGGSQAPEITGRTWPRAMGLGEEFGLYSRYSGKPLWGGLVGFVFYMSVCFSSHGFSTRLRTQFQGAPPCWDRPTVTHRKFMFSKKKYCRPSILTQRKAYSS